MKMWRILTLAVVLLTVSAPVIARVASWMAPATPTVLFALAPSAAVALLLVFYFKWRATLKSQILAEKRDDELAGVA